MQGIWEAMRDFANPCSVLTKSPLLLRDIELMKEICERTEFVANLSIPTLEEKAWRADRATHAAPAQADRGGRRARAGRDPDRGADRADHPRASTTRPARSRSSSRRWVRPAPRASAESGCTCAARCARSGSTGCASTGRTCVPRYEELYRRGAYMPAEERERLGGPGAGRSVGRGGSPSSAARRAKRGVPRSAGSACARRASSERSSNADESDHERGSTLTKR